MHIESISLRNFRCFGDTPVKISISAGMTAFVGDNGAGKTAALEALKKLFSPISSERQIKKEDVHFGLEEDSNTVNEREIVIDVVFSFSAPDSSDIASVFNDIFFNAEDDTLKARLSLECLYKKSESYEDDIEVKIYIIRTLEDVPFGSDDERKIPLRGRTTQFAELVYIPAHRDALGITRYALKNVLKRIERSADWDDETREKSQDFAKKLETKLNEVTAIESVTTDLKEFWGKLHDDHYEAKPIFSVVATEFEQLIRDLTLRFEKSPGGGQRQLEELSEGQVSLLYFALSATLHSLIWKMQNKVPEKLEGFKVLDFEPSPLTIFALEEPENHLAPFYLPRLINLLKGLITDGAAQAFVTSHSPSVLSRIPPRDVRYFRNCKEKLISEAREIPLPDKGSAEDKFLHEAILANPEIYFARLVIIGEGDSERIVIPRIAEALGVTLDPSFIAFVPIGGRHAQHLWKLTKGLNIPCLTLLDFDLGRHQGGMGRIKNAITWLKDAKIIVDDKDMPQNEELTQEKLEQWIKKLRAKNVFYSTPLDLDMMMIQAFPDAYTPNRELTTKPKDDLKKIKKSVFGETGLGNEELKFINQNFTKEDLFTYKNLFKTNAKPASHFESLSKLKNKTIRKNCPEPIKALIEAAQYHLSPPRSQSKKDGDPS